MITKERIIQAFDEAQLPIERIALSRLGDGYFVYHPHAFGHSYTKYTIKEQTDKYTIKLKEKKQTKCDFIDDEDTLTIALSDAHRRI